MSRVASHFPIRAYRRAQRGLGLIELMISMVLGLLVVGGAISVFLSSQQTYRATESLARVQESGRVAFELMAREVREAAGNACGNNLPTANVLNGGGTWWSNWQDGVRGYENGGLAGSAAGTDAIDLTSAVSGGVTVVDTPSTTSANFKVNTNDHNIEDGDILMVCDYTQASIFQATNVNSSNVTIVHNTGGSVSPGNCTKSLGLPVNCGPHGSPKIYGPNSKIVQLKASRWYVADNGRGGRSLYRAQMDQGVMGDAEEITQGIQDMQLQYLLAGANQYVDAGAGLDWGKVIAVRIVLTVQSADDVGTDGEPLQRTVEHVVTLRNRIS